MTQPVPVRPNVGGTFPVAPKVKYTSIAMYLLGVVGLALTSAMTAADNQLLIEVLPDPVEVFALPLIPTLVAFVVGFASKHQPRLTDTAVQRASGVRGTEWADPTSP